MKILKGTLAVLVLLIGYLLLWPVKVDPVAWTPPAPPPPTQGDRLRSVQRIGTALDGPEGIAFDAQGLLYAGTADGRLLRIDAQKGECQVLDSTGGRPLGLAVAEDGGLFIADARRGLLKLDAAGNLSVLATSAEGVDFGFTDDVDVSRDGLVYFTDASSKFGYGKQLDDVIEHGRHGRLLRFDPAKNETEVLLQQLPFANGVALGPDQQSLVVVEMSEYRLTRYWIAGEKAGQREVFADNLPGFADNLSFNGRDRYWVAIYGPRDATLDSLLPNAFARKIIARLPSFLRPKPRHEAHVMGFDLDGKLVADWSYSGADTYAPITSVEERDGWLYLGSLEAQSLGRIKLEDALSGQSKAPEPALAIDC